MAPSPAEQPRAARKPSPHCTLIAVDIVGFGAMDRDDDVQLVVRDALYRLLPTVFDTAGVPWHACRYSDRGDGALIVVPPRFPTSVVIDPIFLLLDAYLRRYNKVASEAATIRLRMAAHAGAVHFDANGVTGRATIHLFRLLDAPGFKNAIAASPVDLGLIASDDLYSNVIRHGYGLLDPALYQPLEVDVKETRCQAWMLLPQGPHHREAARSS